MRQDYKPEEITIITMYTGQLIAIRKKTRGDDSFKGLKVTSVDNFQGESERKPWIGNRQS